MQRFLSESLVWTIALIIGRLQKYLMNPAEIHSGNGTGVLDETSDFRPSRGGSRFL